MSKYKVGTKYDCGFLKGDGNFVGLMLTRDKSGYINYYENTDLALSQQYFTGTPGYANLEAEKEIQVGQSSFKGGFGQEFYDDENRYYTSIGADARFENGILPGPKPTAIALPATVETPLTITNGNMETWASSTSLTGWTKSSGGLDTTRETAIIRDGAYSCKMLDNATTSYYIYQNAATWSNDWRGKTVKFTAWAYCADHTKTRVTLTIDDGVGTTNSSSVGVSTTWTHLSVTRTLNVSATKCSVRINYEYVTADSACYVDAAGLQCDCMGAPSCACAFNGNLYFAFGSKIYKLNATGDGFTSVGSVYGAITDLEVFGDYMYICCGGDFTDEKYSYMGTAETITLSTLTDGQAEFMGVIGDTLYKLNNPSTAEQSVNPINGGSWPTSITVGSTLYDFTGKPQDLIGLPILAKQNMPYYVDTSGNPYPLIPEAISEYASDSGKNAFVHMSNYYYPCGTQTLYEYTADGVTSVLSPSMFISNSDDFDGQIQALSGDAQYLFAGVENGTKVEIMAGRFEYIGSSSAWVWHPLSEITLAGIQQLYTSTIYKRRLWILSTSSSDSVYYIPLTTMYGNITGDTDYEFLSGGSIVTSYHHANFRADNKAWFKITLTMSSTSASDYWEAYYQKLGDTGWTKIDDFKVSPTTTKYLPADSIGLKPYSCYIRFKFVPIVSASVPVLIAYDVRAVWYPPSRTVINLQVKCADGLVLKDRTIDEEQTSATIRNAVDELSNPSISWPCEFYPPYYTPEEDNSMFVRFLAPVEYRNVVDPETRNSEWIYNLKLLVIDGIEG